MEVTKFNSKCGINSAEGSDPADEEMWNKYTFLLPAYKAKFFAEALESIKNQTYKDFVCLVSDDCSPEDLKSIFDEVVGGDSRFTFRRNTENMGSKSLVSHWNLLVDMCETEFFIMASDDDVYEPNFLEEIDKLTEKYPEVDLFRGRVKYIDENNSLLRKDFKLREFQDQLHFLHSYYTGSLLSCEACFCYRRKTFVLNQKYKDFPLAWFTDDAAHILQSEKGCSITSEIVFTYRSSNIAISSITNSPTIAKQKLLAAFDFWDWYFSQVTMLKYSEERALKNSVVNIVSNRINTNIIYLSQELNFKGLIWMLKTINSRGGTPRLFLLYNWIRKRI